MSLLLVRHGESEGNALRIMQGTADYPLTARGREQAGQVAERLRDEGGADRIVASPLARAVETARAIATVLDLSVNIDGRLAEYDFGEANGLRWPEFRARYPDWRWDNVADRPFAPVPGEEGLPAFDARVAEVVAELAALGGRTVAVAHGGVVMSALNAVLRPRGGGRRLRAHTGNCSITEVARDGTGRLVLRRHNDGHPHTGLSQRQAGSTSAISQA